MTSSWFFLSTLNYDARSTTHQILQYCLQNFVEIMFFNDPRIPPKRKQLVGLSYRRLQTTCIGLCQFCNFSLYKRQYYVFLLKPWMLVLGVKRTICILKRGKQWGLFSLNYFNIVCFNININYFNNILIFLFLY